MAMHIYEVRPRKDHRGADLISDVLTFGRLCYGEPKAASNAIGYRDREAPKNRATSKSQTYRSASM
jgi:hypothetical protein